MKLNPIILGAGYVGRRLTAALNPSKTTVRLTSRSPEKVAELNDLGFNASQLDLENAIWPDWNWHESQMFFLAPPPNEGTKDPRMQAFLARFSGQNRPARLVYISTTGVYGDCQGQWVNEKQPTQPTAERSLRRLDAEQQLHQFSQQTGCAVIILRVAGIYGPNRLPLSRLQQGLPMVSQAEAPWTNRIHVDDLVTVLIAAMDKGTAGEIYNVSDGNPGNMRDYFDRIADLAQLPRAPLIRLKDSGSRLSAGMRSYLAESRRLDNSKMLTELGVELRFPDLSRGLADCFSASEP